VQRAYVGSRRAARWVGFFLPYLRAGMSLLDCGCGVGSITLDLAEIVVPGQVVGIDTDVSQLEVARSEAARRGLTNVRFEVASVHALPFPDASFDAALAHTLLIHLRDPLGAIRAMRRVLKARGVIAVSDDDASTFRVAPPSPFADRYLDLLARILVANGGSPTYSPQLRHLLMEAGFARTEGHAVAADYYGTLEETRQFARLAEQLLRHPANAGLITGQGWASQEELDAIVEWARAWGDRPDAFAALMYCAAVGWVGEQPS
jgi:ubiquinone/menaquinone biosynthesis C-methylase UbiE